RSRSISQHRRGKTGWAAAPVDAEFAAREGADVESGSSQFSIRFLILFDGKQTLASERQNVAGQSVALGILNLNEIKTARPQQFDGPARNPRTPPQTRTSLT